MNTTKEVYLLIKGYEPIDCEGLRESEVGVSTQQGVRGQRKS